MKLHVLTAVSRPENLPQVAASLATAAENAPGVSVSWHWRFDTERQNVGGQALKNRMLDEISDGWVWILDDDTLTHPGVLASVLDASAGFEAVVVSQQRSSGHVLAASAEAVCPGWIDAGQAFIRRDLIGDDRIPLNYDGDGLWLQAVLTGSQQVIYLNEVLSLHNAISGVEVSA